VVGTAAGTVALVARGAFAPSSTSSILALVASARVSSAPPFVAINSRHFSSSSSSKKHGSHPCSPAEPTEQLLGALYRWCMALGRPSTRSPNIAMGPGAGVWQHTMLPAQHRCIWRLAGSLLPVALPPRPLTSSPSFLVHRARLLLARLPGWLPVGNTHTPRTHKVNCGATPGHMRLGEGFHTARPHTHARSQHAPPAPS